MPCNSPNKVFYIGWNNETGKRKILFTSRNADFVYRRSPHDRWIVAYRQNGLSAATFARRGYQVISDGDLVPCGQCLGCRLDYAREWSARIMAEKKNYSDDLSWFITLTYDDSHLPKPRMIPDKVDEETGEVITFKPSPFSSVDKKVHQKFMKRVRKKFQPKVGVPIKYFCSGEYGSLSGRCHYHYIIFGLKLDDLQLVKNNRLGDSIYTSAELQSCWTDDKHIPLGFVGIGSVTTDSAGYCARYAIKKRKVVDVDTYAKLGIDPEFICMSTKPALGKRYFEDNLDKIYKTDEIIMQGRDAAFVTKPPKYCDTLLDRVDPEKLEMIKQKRKANAKSHDDFIAEYLPFMEKEEIYKTRERKLNKNTKILMRRDFDG